MERCRREISAIETEIRAGNPDLRGLRLAFRDESAELRILQDEKRRQARAQRRDAGGKGGVQALTE